MGVLGKLATEVINVLCNRTANNPLSNGAAEGIEWTILEGVPLECSNLTLLLTETQLDVGHPESDLRCVCMEQREGQLLQRHRFACPGKGNGAAASTLPECKAACHRFVRSLPRCALGRVRQSMHLPQGHGADKWRS